MKTILIIDDDHGIHEMYREVFTLEGYRVLHSYTGEDGLQKIGKHKPDLLLLDIELGCGITGRDILLELKRTKNNTPILFISGKSGMQNELEIEISPNVYHFFVKPVTLQEITQAIKNILGKDTVALDATNAKTCKIASELDAPEPVQTTPNSQIISGSPREKKIAGYDLEAFVGEGTYGEVYKGHYLNTPIAIKIFRKDTLTEPEMIERFQREALILASVSHPNIVELMDTGKTKNGNYFMVMKYFDGESIATILQREKTIPVSEAIEIVIAVAQGMATAHKARLIHRDLKPSNILYNREKKLVKIIDFGVAKKLQPNDKSTKEGYLIGTPNYMSPEQSSNCILDCRSDIYSLGATFYDMLVGEPPFNHENVIAVLVAQISHPLLWPESASHIPSHIKQIIEKMMAKLANDRYQTMEECVETLQILQKGKKNHVVEEQ